MAASTGHENGPWVIACSFLCGAMTGAAVALLLAPARGRELRDRLAATAREGRGQASKVLDHASQALSEGRAAIADIRERGEQAMQSIRQEGAEAVAEAKTAFKRSRTENARES